MCEKETIIRKALGYFSNYRTLELQLSGARFGSFPPKTAAKTCTSCKANYLFTLFS